MGRCDHHGVELPDGAAWSDAVEEAAWIGERLAPAGACRVTSVVPGGFDAYARVLHPAEDPLDRRPRQPPAPPRVAGAP
jgi:hypothetical protein